MSSEEREDVAVSFEVPPAVEDWAEGQAERRDEVPETVYRRLLSAAASLADDDSIVEPADREALEDLRATVDAQRDEFVTLLEDVRGRVVQVKREVDGKAEVGHAHEDVATVDGLESLETDLDTLASELRSLQETVDSGTENFETVYERLLDRVEVAETRLETLADAHVELRAGVGALEGHREREAAESLKLAANRLGVRSAECSSCSGAVDLALLSRPNCPHCGAAFADVERQGTFFRSYVLQTGGPPALDGRVASEDGDDRSSDDTDDRPTGEVDDRVSESSSRSDSSAGDGADDRGLSVVPSTDGGTVVLDAEVGIDWTAGDVVDDESPTTDGDEVGTGG